MAKNWNQVRKEWKEIVKGTDNLEQLSKGIADMAEIVGSTMGAKGRTVNIYSAAHDEVKSTKDGVTVVKNIYPKDEMELVGVTMAKEVSEKVVEEAGDGTTTSMVLTNALIKVCVQMIKDGVEPYTIVLALTEIQNYLRDFLSKTKKEITTEEELYNIANIASNSDKEIASLIVEAIVNTSEDTVINLAKGDTYESKVDYTDGYSFDRGYFNENFKDENKIKTEYDSPLIFITSEELVGKYDVEAAMTVAMEAKAPLVIICKDLVQEAYNYVVMNRLRMAIPVVAIKAPRFGQEQLNALEDIATYTGGKVFGRNDGYALSNVSLEDMGTCSAISCGSDYTHIFSGGGMWEDVSTRIAGLKLKLDDTISRDKHSHFVADIKTRISKLEGGICTIYVGGGSEAEISEKYDRYEDSLLATTSAIKSGYVSGGGAFYARAAHNLSNITDKNVNTLATALYIPMYQILTNGHCPGLLREYKHHITAECSDNYDATTGVNVLTQRVCNNYTEGIIDSAKIPETVIEVVFSFVKTFITSSASLVHKVEYFNNL